MDDIPALEYLWEPHVEIEFIWKTSRHNFDRLFQKFPKKLFHFTETTDHITHDNDKITYNSSNEIISHQTKHIIHTFYDDKFKSRVSTEIYNSIPKDVSKINIKEIRNKKRWSINLKWMTLDFTIVNNVSYEIELEINIHTARNYNIEKLKTMLHSQLEKINQTFI